MQIKQYFSGSSGNLYIVTANNGQRLMIECGVTWAKLQKALGYDLSGIVACFVSHSHNDHCKAIKDVVKSGISVYASEETFEGKGITGRRVEIIKNGDLIRKVGPFEVLVFDTEHDVEGSVGFVVREVETNEYLLFATDTAYLKQKFPMKFSIIAIEVSYDKNILQDRVDSGDINETLAKRLLNSHFEKSACMDYISDHLDLSKCHEIHLLHLSGDNLDKAKTVKEFESKFFIDTVTV